MHASTVTPLADVWGRRVSYLRLSVTDRCNLRCIYCAPERPQFIPHANVLRYEEMAGLISLAKDLGVEKVRLTGGEPLLRKGLTEFVSRVLADNPGLDLRITTNGTLLGRHAEALRRAGVDKVNISLDTLDREDFAYITGRDQLETVLQGIDLCLGLGIRVKVNAVAMPSLNKKQIPRFLDFVRQRPIDVRFIERMPVGDTGRMRGEPRWRAEEILAEVARFARLTPVHAHGPNCGPARLYALEGHAGRFGVISSISQHFCKTCNRLRITSDGRLRTCLYSDKQYRLLPLLRHEKLGAEQALKVIRLATRSKPQGHQLLAAAKDEETVCSTAMHSIGG